MEEDFGLVWFMVFNAIFNNFSYIMVVSFICGGNQSTQRKSCPAALVTKKDSQYNGQKKKDKNTHKNMIHKTLHKKLKVELHEPIRIPG